MSSYIGVRGRNEVSILNLFSKRRVLAKADIFSFKFVSIMFFIVAFAGILAFDSYLKSVEKSQRAKISSMIDDGRMLDVELSETKAVYQNIVSEAQMFKSAQVLGMKVATKEKILSN